MAAPGPSTQPCVDGDDEAYHLQAYHLQAYHLKGCYAARTVARNLATSAFSRLFSLESICADESTWEDAEPVSAAPRLTSAILVATCVEPTAACCTLRAISWVAAPCSSTAAAIAVADRKSTRLN